MRRARVYAAAALAAIFLSSCRSVAPGDRAGGSFLLVDISEQKLFFMNGERVEKTYDVSTSRYGVGSLEGSQRTPLGLHRVSEKIGDGAPPMAVFVDRKPTGRVARPNLKPTPTGEDLITSRVLWLEGLEPGRNRGGSVDSHDRFIYIHGTADEGLIGSPASHGCVRMRNVDVIELYDRVPPGTRVEIRL